MKYVDINLNFVRYEVLTAVRMSMLFSWIMTPCRLVGRYQRFFSPEDGDSIFLRNVIYLRVYRASQLRRTTSST
jgi:hypothetical protein